MVRDKQRPREAGMQVSASADLDVDRLLTPVAGNVRGRCGGQLRGNGCEKLLRCNDTDDPYGNAGSIPVIGDGRDLSQGRPGSYDSPSGSAGLACDCSWDAPSPGTYKGNERNIVSVVFVALSLLLFIWITNDAVAQSRARVVFFVGDDGQHGRELWISDGTGSGTHLVRDIRPGSVSSDISQLTPAGDRVFFTAVNKDGRELWVSDGTRAGTRRVRDIWPGPLGSQPRLLTPFGSDILFVADGRRGKSLWVSDGTRSGTKHLLSRSQIKRVDDIQDMLAIGKNVFIVDRSEIVVFDTGTSQLIRVAETDDEVIPFIDTSLSQMNRKVVIRDRPNLFETGNLSYIDRQLRRRNVVDIRTGEPVATYFNREGLAVRNRLFFGRGVVLPGIPNESRIPDGLWVWDPKLGGAYNIAFPSREIPQIAALGPNVAFTVGEVNATLWYSDGTEGGTYQLFIENVPNLASAGAFVGFMPNAVELWISDGTAAGTQLVADFSTVAINSGFPTLVGDRGRLWFSVDYIGFGRELWTSDGTFSGTRSPGDFRPGPDGLDPSQITPAWILSATM